jgi:activator of Hsp90 ATPase-like protein
MDQHDFTTSFLVDQTPAEVFKAVTNVRGWWSVGIEGDTEKLNDEFIYQVEGVHYSNMQLIDVVPDERVVWLVKYNYLSFVKDKSEWTGTKVHFDISRQGDKTQLRFTHEGLVPEYECYDVCTPAWTNYVQGSLLPLITTGKGHPNQETA